MKTVGRLFLLLTVVTAIELFLLIKLAGWTSWTVTIATVIVPGLVGAWLLKREGTRAFRQIGEALSEGREPGGAILDGVLVLLAGAFLVTPGVLTDLAGLALLVPPIRARVRGVVARKVRSTIERKLSDGSLFASGGVRGGRVYEPGTFEVIDAEDIPKPDRR